MLVILVISVMKSLVIFCFFFYLWVGVFTVLIIETGFEVKDADTEFPNLDRLSRSFLRIFRNSLGDIQAPTYTYWTEVQKQSALGNIMIYSVWLVWLGNELLMMIVLLNFLIAIVGDSYNKIS